MEVVSFATNNVFGATTTAEATAFCYMQGMDEKGDVLAEIAGILLEKKILKEVF